MFFEYCIASNSTKVSQFCVLFLNGTTKVNTQLATIERSYLFAGTSSNLIARGIALPDYKFQLSRAYESDIEALLPKGWRPFGTSRRQADPYETHPILSIQLADTLREARRRGDLVGDRECDRHIIADLVNLVDLLVSRTSSISARQIRAGEVAAATSMREQAEQLQGRLRRDKSARLANPDDEVMQDQLARLIDRMKTRAATLKALAPLPTRQALDARDCRFLVEQAQILAQKYGLKPAVACVDRSRSRVSSFVILISTLGTASGFDRDVSYWQGLAA